jgi:hypothetical protein
MDLKNARSRLATARTAQQKADSIIGLCLDMEKYLPARHTLEMLQRELHQQVGRLDFINETLKAIEGAVPDDNETDE